MFVARTKHEVGAYHLPTGDAVDLPQSPKEHLAPERLVLTRRLDHSESRQLAPTQFTQL